PQGSRSRGPRARGAPQRTRTTNCGGFAILRRSREGSRHNIDWPDYLRDEAAKYRQLAEQTDDPVVQNEMLELASVWDEVANNIEDHLTARFQGWRGRRKPRKGSAPDAHHAEDAPSGLGPEADQSDKAYFLADVSASRKVCQVGRRRVRVGLERLEVCF